ncbi:tyrosine-type recombinase/integrase [Salinimicrobium sp. MT39]|uniref:Tyrosine-type recombinase/integrase n=1 Tax=Salinimicrobium profundisediminis TaxID=2994553 RepID=A0A9X3D1Y0_9FLAO|nr:tyrosine-type recombinase/integrase [Salinimicrobium profundisediminis]MCX2839844.1 tyrosine-type recombinase/integrase [Salinimicrobium profundisediminis]
MYRKLKRSVELAGKSQSTLTNYSRCLAHLTLYFKCSPLDLDEEQILDYLHVLKSQHKTPSDSFFKHTIYGLRYAYRMCGMQEMQVILPSIERPNKLPVVLSRSEVKQLLKAPKLLKHRLVLAMLYGCGLRCFELRNLQLRDLDFDRKMLHIRQGKGRKDRYVPLSKLQIRGLKKYITAENPSTWCFNGYDRENNPTALSTRGVQWIVREARKHSGIQKEITTHSLRHSYATHLLEMGLDIMSVKDLLGHADIQTTLTYLHVAQLGRQKPFSPLDRLYNK